MATWSEFERQVPAMAARGRGLFFQYGPGAGFLATVGADGCPRIHPVSPVVHEGGLYTFILPGSPRLRDLERDGRFALHAPGPDDVDDEFYVTGRAHRVEDSSLAERLFVARRASGVVPSLDAASPLFELSLERALLATYTSRGQPDSWPPRYDKWHDLAPAESHSARRPAATSSDVDAVSWEEFAQLEPELAAAGRGVIRQFGIGLGYLGTVRPDGGPRLHPFCPTFSGDRLYGLILPESPKCKDMLRDPRVAIHAVQGPSRDEFCVAGIAVPINDRAMENQVRASAMADGMTSTEDEQLFEFLIDRAMLAAYTPGPVAAWPPLYAKWRAGSLARRG